MKRIRKRFGKKIVLKRYQEDAEQIDRKISSAPESFF